MTQSVIAKRSHANGEQASREAKARGIERALVARGIDLGGSDVLDIGSGAGYISSYLARRSRSLVGVDVVDERRVHDFDFRLVSSEQLPVAGASMDVVVSNHVIEHVDNQLLHLVEIGRVLRPDGVCYLATPNRFALVEPHFGLPLLSWMRPTWRDRYVRVTGKGTFYDVMPLTHRRLHDLAAQAQFAVEDCSLSRAREVLEERLPIVPPLPDVLRTVLPSFVVLLKPRPS